jgi:hypothetical protein
LPFSWRESRSADGVTADAVLLRAPDPTHIARLLTAAGAESVTDPDAWLLEHREVATDPDRIEQLRAAEQTVARRSRIAMIAWGASTGLVVAARFFDSLWLLAAGGACAVTGFLMERSSRAGAAVPD